ncbi:DUF4397 domain-containing protein [Rubrivirga sp.]|uniref:DUF4397 domain-containing protein n=1 Tax=Rubrivirga sp. TaxID=1885344 RepID=UPI003C788023
MRTATLLGLAILLALPASAQIRLQVIHNAPDPSASTVDVYVNGDLTLDDFEFRTATLFLDLPSDTDLEVAVAPGTSASVADALAAQTFNLPTGAYQLIASGVLDADDFADNPSGTDIGFQLLAGTNALEVGGSTEAAAVRVVHGSPDAPAVDVRIANVDGPPLVDDASYTDITGYLALPTLIAVLDVTTADGAATVASFEVDLTGAGGAAVTVLASGFLTPGDNQDGPGFGLLAVFADGTTALLEAPSSIARLQVIHNAADPAASTVDVYVNGDILLDDFAFRTASPFIDVPADTDLEVAIAPGTSSSAGDAVFTQTYSLPDGSTTQLIANGVLSPGDFEANPDGVDTAFELLVGGDAQEASNGDTRVAIRVVHGSTDAPTVDVRTGGSVLVDDATYTDVTGYLEVEPDTYQLDVTTADGTTTAASFIADLSAAGGGAVMVLASGFLSPDNDQNGPAFGLLAVFPDGTAALLPAGVVSVDEAPEAGVLALGLPAPNPAVGATRLSFSLEEAGSARLVVYDALGRAVATLVDGQMNADAFEVDLETAGLAAGAYIIRLDTSAGSRTRALTVVR